MNRALISLGANSPDKHRQLQQAIATIEHMATITARTPIYETPAEGSTAAAPYANALLRIVTPIPYEELRATFKHWEQEAGRTPQSKLQGIIPLDIDIVVWNDKLLKERDMHYDYMKLGMSLLEDTDK